MSVTARSLFAPNQAANATTMQYTATGVRTIIDKFTGTNTTAGAVTLTVFLVPNAGAAGVTNTIVSARSLAAGECYTFPEIVGHVLIMVISWPPSRVRRRRSRSAAVG